MIGLPITPGNYKRVIEFPTGEQLTESEKTYHFYSYLDSSLYISKDSKEGIFLARLLETEDCLPTILTFLQVLFLGEIEKKELIHLIQRNMNSAYHNGEEHAKLEIRKALGFRN